MLLDVVLHDCLVFHIQLSVEVCSVYMVGRLWIFCVHVWGISGLYILHVSKPGKCRLNTSMYGWWNPLKILVGSIRI